MNITGQMGGNDIPDHVHVEAYTCTYWKAEENIEVFNEEVICGKKVLLKHTRNNNNKLQLVYLLNFIMTLARLVITSSSSYIEDLTFECSLHIVFMKQVYYIMI